MTTNKPEQTRTQKLQSFFKNYQTLQAKTEKALDAVIVVASVLDFTAKEANEALGVDFIKDKGNDAEKTE